MKSLANTIIGILLISSSVIAQYDMEPDYSGVRANTFFVEGQFFPGTSITPAVGYGSFNYERKVGKRRFTALRVGLTKDINSTVYGVPTTISWLTNPAGHHHFEAGGGLNNRIETFQGRTHWDFFISAFAKFRYENQRGFFLNCGMYYYGYKTYLYPVGILQSLAIGYQF